MRCIKILVLVGMARQEDHISSCMMSQEVPSIWTRPRPILMMLPMANLHQEECDMQGTGGVFTVPRLTLSWHLSWQSWGWRWKGPGHLEKSRLTTCWEIIPQE